MTPTIAVNRYECKRYAATSKNGHLYPMPDKEKKAPASPLNELFRRRVQEVMEDQGTNANQVSQRHGSDVRQRTLADILNGADPQLSTVWKVCVALGVSPAELLMHSGVRQENPTKSPSVTTLPEVPRALKQSGKSRGKKGRDRIVKGG